MAASIPIKPKKRGRPPSGGRDPFVGFRAPHELLQGIDKWRQAQPDKPSRSAAIRMLVEIGLVSQENAHPISSKLADDLGSFA
jgi:hypothetical protein